MMRARPVLSLLLVGLAACAAAPGDAGGPPKPAASAPQAAPMASLMGTRWVGEKADGPATPRLEFLDGGRIAGYTGCNMLSGAWRMEGGEVRLGNVATTKRFCAGPEGEMEKRMLAAIGADTTVRREGAKLVLSGPGGARFELIAAP